MIFLENLTFNTEMTSSHCRVATERMKVRKHLILFCRSFLGWELSRARRKGGGVKSSGAETTPSTQADSTLVNVYQVGKFKEETSVLSVPPFLLPLLFAKLWSAPVQETPVLLFQSQLCTEMKSLCCNSRILRRHVINAYEWECCLRNNPIPLMFI